eukprot:jgi/Tetstr1/451495/TSEL_038531.t1
MQSGREGHEFGRIAGVLICVASKNHQYSCWAVGQRAGRPQGEQALQVAEIVQNVLDADLLEAAPGIEIASFRIRFRIGQHFPDGYRYGIGMHRLYEGTLLGGRIAANGFRRNLHSQVRTGFAAYCGDEVLIALGVQHVPAVFVADMGVDGTGARRKTLGSATRRLGN